MPATEEVLLTRNERWRIICELNGLSDFRENCIILVLPQTVDQKGLVGHSEEASSIALHLAGTTLTTATSEEGESF